MTWQARSLSRTRQTAAITASWRASRRLKEIAAEDGARWIAEGSNADEPLITAQEHELSQNWACAARWPKLA